MKSAKIEECVAFQDKLPEGTSFLESQVAGHPFDTKKNTIGEWDVSLLLIML